MVRPTEHEIWSAIDEVASKETMKMVAKWLSTSEGQEWIKSHSEEMFRVAERQEQDSVPSADMLEAIHKKIFKLQVRARYNRIITVAAAVLLPLILVSMVWLNINSRVGDILFSKVVMEEESAAMGERKVVVFQDGSRVYLNSGAKISYPKTWGLGSRRMSLEGEAFFDVVKNHRRTFVVDVFNTKIKVYGTRFNVNAYPESEAVNVVLLDGDVAFSVNDKEYDMKPSELLEYHKDNGSVRISSIDAADNSILWTQNVIMFKNDSLKDVVEILERWYDVEFIVEDEELYSRRFTLRSSSHQMLSALLYELEYISDLSFELKDNIVFVNKK